MEEKRLVVKEQSLADLASIIRDKACTTEQYSVDELVEVARTIGNPELEELKATDNGVYTPTKYGYSRVEVAVQPECEEIVITENGEYTSTKDGFNKVIVDCPPPPPEEAFTLTGKCDYRFANNGWNWFINTYGNKIKTENISSMTYIANKSTKVKSFPFVFNTKGCNLFSSSFSDMTDLEICPKIRGSLGSSGIGASFSLDGMIQSCQKLRDVEDLFEPDAFAGWSSFKITSSYSAPKPINFYSCYSLRKVPTWLYKIKLNPESTAFPSTNSILYKNLFRDCYVLDEILNLQVWTCTAAATSNLFSDTFTSCERAKDITFETDNGQPIVAMWKTQTIDLTKVGFGYDTHVEGYNSGITLDKRVQNDEQYAALKNDPDWYCCNDAKYSRYNHDSAVETINSLPDTSAYLASAGGTNTIKFKKASGAKTDGGAIENLTAEEIAVAAAKGWTVSLVS